MVMIGYEGKKPLSDQQKKNTIPRSQYVTKYFGINVRTNVRYAYKADTIGKIRLKTVPTVENAFFRKTIKNGRFFPTLLNLIIFIEQY